MTPRICVRRDLRSLKPGGLLWQVYAYDERKNKDHVKAVPSFTAAVREAINISKEMRA